MVSKDLGDINPQFNRWTQRELVTSLVYAQRAIAKYLPLSCVRTDAVKLVPGTRQTISAIPVSSIIPGDGSAASVVNGIALQSVLRNMGSTGSVPGPVIWLGIRSILDTNYPNWHASTAPGTVPKQYIFDINTPQIFYVNPGVPASGAVWVETSIMAMPVGISNVISDDYGKDGVSTVTIGIGDQYCDDLHNYVMGMAHMKNAESQASLDLAQVYMTRFATSLNAQVAALGGINPNLQAAQFLQSKARQ